MAIGYSAPATPASTPSSTLIATINATGSTTSVTFNNIPQTYTNLQIVALARTTQAAHTDGLDIWFNNTTNVYDWFRSGNTGLSSIYIQSTAMGASAPSGQFAAIDLTIYNYTSTSSQKSVLGSYFAIDSTSTSTSGPMCAIFRSTNAITRIDLKSDIGANIVSGSVFNLYGLI